MPQLALQITGALAVKSTVCPCWVLAAIGNMLMGDTIFAEVERLAPPLVGVAVMVQVPGTSLAVYKPALVIVPQLAVHVAVRLEVNCWVAPSVMVGFSGVRVAAPTVSIAVAVRPLTPVAVAVMVQLVPAVPDAVNSPPLVILPHDAAQLTAMLAVNCCVAPCGVDAEAGVMLSGLVMVAIVASVWPVPSVAVAVMVQAPARVGAVNRPAPVMLPQLAVHVTASVAANCWVAPSLTVGFSGEIDHASGARTVSYP